MGSDSSNSRGPRTKSLAHHNRSDISELIYNLGRTTRNWQDAHHYVSPEILNRTIGLLHRTYLDDDGVPCGISIQIIEETCPPEGEGHTRLSYSYDDHGRMVRIYERVLTRYNRGLDDLLRRYRALSRNPRDEIP